MTTNYIKKMDAVKVSVSEIKAKLALVKKIGAVESKDSSQPSSHIVVMKEGAGLKILSGLNFIHEIFMTCENDVSHYEDGAILWGANFKELEYSINVICKANKNEELFIYAENDFSYIETISGSVKKFAMFGYECVIENRQRFTNAYTCVGEINAGYFKNMPKDSIFLTLYPYSKEVFLGNTKSFVSFKTSSLDGIDVEDMLRFYLWEYLLILTMDVMNGAIKYLKI